MEVEKVELLAEGKVRVSIVFTFDEFSHKVALRAGYVLEEVQRLFEKFT